MADVSFVEFFPDVGGAVGGCVELLIVVVVKINHRLAVSMRFAHKNPARANQNQKRPSFTTPLRQWLDSAGGVCIVVPLCGLGKPLFVHNRQI